MMTDHAELARRLRVSWPDRGWVVSNKIKELLSEAREAADALDFLLSENAALRAKGDPANWNDKEDQWSQDIVAAHPVNSTDPLRHKHFETALEMVGNRRGKYELVGLVQWLLTRANQAERQRDEAVRLLRRIAETPSEQYDDAREADAIRIFLASMEPKT